MLHFGDKATINQWDKAKAPADLPQVLSEWQMKVNCGSRNFDGIPFTWSSLLGNCLALPHRACAYKNDNAIYRKIGKVNLEMGLASNLHTNLARCGLKAREKICGHTRYGVWNMLIERKLQSCQRKRKNTNVNGILCKLLLTAFGCFFCLAKCTRSLTHYYSFLNVL